VHWENVLWMKACKTYDSASSMRKHELLSGQLKLWDVFVEKRHLKALQRH